MHGLGRIHAAICDREGETMNLCICGCSYYSHNSQGCQGCDACREFREDKPAIVQRGTFLYLDDAGNLVTADGIELKPGASHQQFYFDAYDSYIRSPDTETAFTPEDESSAFNAYLENWGKVAQLSPEEVRARVRETMEAAQSEMVFKVFAHRWWVDEKPLDTL